MPYKNRNEQLHYLKEYRETHKEDAWWAQSLWREDNRERKRALDKKSRLKNKSYYNCLARLRRKFKKLSEHNLIYIEIDYTK